MPYPAEKLKDVYTILKNEGRKDRWVRIGIGFVNRDQSISIRLDAVPTNGTLHIRDYSREYLKRADTETLALPQVMPTHAGFSASGRTSLAPHLIPQHEAMEHVDPGEPMEIPASARGSFGHLQMEEVEDPSPPLRMAKAGGGT